MGAESKRAMRTGVAFSGGGATSRFPTEGFAPSVEDAGEGEV